MDNYMRMKQPNRKEIIAIVTGLILLILSLCSCRTKYIPVELKTTETITVRDTLISLKLVPYKDSVSVKADSSYLSNPYAYSWARVGKDGMLYHSLGIIPQAEVKGKIMFLDKTTTKEVGVPIEVIKEVPKKLNRWEKFINWCGYALLIGIVVLIIAWFRRFSLMKIRD